MEQQEALKKKDDTVIGFVIVGGVLFLILGFMYLLSVQKSSTQCTPQFNPDGSIQTGCAVPTGKFSPTPAGPVQFLDRLNPQEKSEVDKRLEEATLELQRKMQGNPQQ